MCDQIGCALIGMQPYYFTHYHLNLFHFVLFKFKDLVAKQHPTNMYTCFM